MDVQQRARWSGAGQRHRLEPLETLYDRGTTALLAALGVGPGWHCLEVAAGAGSVTRWLADQVGPTGRVLATDIDVSLLEAQELEGVEVVAHDLDGGPLERDAFDLVHARLLLEHLPARERVLGELISSVRPGGWLMIEDMDWDALRPLTERGAVAYRRTGAAMRELFSLGGYDATLGARLHRMLCDHGLQDVGNEGRAQVIHGGSAIAHAFYRRSLEDIAGPLIGLGILDRAGIDAGLAWADDPDCAGVPAMLVAAWGRRPPT